jgi:hypothetical protein
MQSETKQTSVVKTIETTVTKAAGEALDGAEHIYESAGQHFERTVEPIRKGVLQRFPVVFLLAVTVGMVSLSAGIEQVLIQNNLLQDHPWFIVGFGIVILAITGTFYKKLG